MKKSTLLKWEKVKPYFENLIDGYASTVKNEVVAPDPDQFLIDYNNGMRYCKTVWNFLDENPNKFKDVKAAVYESKALVYSVAKVWGDFFGCFHTDFFGELDALSLELNEEEESNFIKIRPRTCETP